MTRITRRPAYFQLLRPPNLVTAFADVLAGCLFVGGGTGQLAGLGILGAASVCFYAGGVTLNDVFDATRDAVGRPERPIPSGAVARRHAAILGTALLLAGLGLCAARGGSAITLGLGLAACIVGYDAILKRTVLGPAAMGVCRALNLCLGMSLSGSLAGEDRLFATGLMCLYVASVTWFARYEAVRSERWRLQLGAAGVVLAVLGLAGLPAVVEEPDRWSLILVGVLLGQVTIHARRAVRSGAPADVQRAIKIFVTWLIVFDACLVFAARGALVAGVVAALLIPAAMLGRSYRIT